MNSDVKSYKALIVSASEKFNSSVLPILNDAGYTDIKSASSCSFARRTLLEDRFDAVIINTPLPDEFGTKMAIDIASDTSTGIILFVKSEHFAESNARLSSLGVITISKPTTAGIVTQSVSILRAIGERIRRMERKNATVEEKIEEIRLVNRAKWLLIDNLKMTEPEAHTYIEKTAMDTCRPKLEIAKSIISIYK